MDWDLVCGNPLAATKMLKRTLERMKETSGGPAITAVSGDNGFDSAPNRKMLKDAELYDAICSKGPDDLRERMKECQFNALITLAPVELQKRRIVSETAN